VPSRFAPASSIASIQEIQIGAILRSSGNRRNPTGPSRADFSSGGGASGLAWPQSVAPVSTPGPQLFGLSCLAIVPVPRRICAGPALRQHTGNSEVAQLCMFEQGPHKIQRPGPPVCMIFIPEWRCFDIAWPAKVLPGQARRAAVIAYFRAWRLCLSRADFRPASTPAY
jgi:hypothetical protein